MQKMARGLWAKMLISALLFIAMSTPVAAAPLGVTFQGRLTDSAGVPLDASSVDLYLSVVSPGAEECTLYEEKHTLNFQGSGGVFSVNIGGGVRQGDDPGLAIDAVFSNASAKTGLSACSVGSSYNPTDSDHRLLYVAFDEGSGPVNFSVPYSIRSVPYALESQKLAGYEAGNMCRVADGGVPQSVDPLTSPEFTELKALIAGTSSQYSKSSTAAGTRMTVINGNPSTPVSGSLWLDSSSGELRFHDGSSTQTIGKANAIDAANITSGTLDAGRLPTGVVAAGTYQSVTVDTTGRVTAGTQPTTLAGYGITDAVVKGGEPGALTLGTSDATPLTINTNATARITVTGTGEVGIGSTTPARKLQVAGEIGINDYIYHNENGVSEAYIGFPANNQIILSADTKNILVGDNSGNLSVRIGDNTEASGSITLENTTYFENEVGIGTTSPGAILDVVDNSTTTSAVVLPRAAAFTGTPINGMVRYNSTNNLFEFRQNGAWINYTTISDGRLKTNIRPLEHPKQLVSQLRPVYFEWDKSNEKTTSFSSKPQVGFIAQEVREVVPEAVDVGEDGLHSMKYGQLVAVAIAAIKEIYKEISSSRQEVIELRKENAEIKGWICKKEPKAPFCGEE